MGLAQFNKCRGRSGRWQGEAANEPRFLNSTAASASNCPTTLYAARLPPSRRVTVQCPSCRPYCPSHQCQVHNNRSRRWQAVSRRGWQLPGLTWCRRRDSNPHVLLRTQDFKSCASAISPLRPPQPRAKAAPAKDVPMLAEWPRRRKPAQNLACSGLKRSVVPKRFVAHAAPGLRRLRVSSFASLSLSSFSSLQSLPSSPARPVELRLQFYLSCSEGPALGRAGQAAGHQRRGNSALRRWGRRAGRARGARRPAPLTLFNSLITVPRDYLACLVPLFEWGDLTNYLCTVLAEFKHRMQ